jgi:hypothetical protein
MSNLFVNKKSHLGLVVMIGLGFLALALGFSLIGLGGQALAAIVKKGEIKAEDAYNPNPGKGDLSLPMPCNLFMVFKAVAIPVNGKMTDFETFMGVDGDAENPFLNDRHLVHLSSDLALENLSEQMRASLADALNQASTDQIFLVGKYEVSQGQWKAVMGDGNCDLDSNSSKPVSNISFYDTELFIDAYMKWLIKNHPDSLPSYKDRPDSIGLIRLPTEEEWEYAARGGHEVSTDMIATQDFFAIAKDDSPRQYGLFAYSGYNNESEPGKIGRWKPNPLGLYDTVGNVSEMVSSPFRMIKHKRVHGAAGGIVIKGGSYDQEFMSVIPGRRIERPFFYSNGPTIAKDLGFRLVVAAPEAVSSVGKQEEINQSFSVLELTDFDNNMGKRGRDRQAQNDQAQNDQAQNDQTQNDQNQDDQKDQPPVKVVDEEKFVGIQDKLPLDKINLLLESALNEDQASLFESLRADIQGINFNQKQSAETAIKTHCRNLQFLVYSIYNTEKRRLDALNNIEILKDLLGELEAASPTKKAENKEEYKKITDKIQNRFDNNLKLARNFEEAIGKEFNYYLENLSKLDNFDSYEVNSVMILIFQDIKGDDLYAKAMRRAHQQVNTDLGNWRMKNRDVITIEAILKNSI